MPGLRPTAVAAALAGWAALAAAPAGAAAPTCAAQAQKVARWGEALLVHYDGGVTVYPADMSYLLMRDALALYGRRDCAPRLLGVALERELTAPQRRRLLSLLPRSIERTLRRALAAAR